MNGVHADDLDYGHFYDTDSMMPIYDHEIIHGNHIKVTRQDEDDKSKMHTHSSALSHRMEKEIDMSSSTYDNKNGRMNAKHFICILGLVTTSLILFECWIFYGLGI